MIHHLELTIDTKFGPKKVTGEWAVRARRSDADMKDVIAEVEDVVARTDARNLAQQLRELAYKRGLGSMDPIWDDVFEMEVHSKGERSLFPIDQAIEMAKKWLPDQEEPAK